jgi:DNA polymerase-3 subunit epsilon
LEHLPGGVGEGCRWANHRKDEQIGLPSRQYLYRNIEIHGITPEQTIDAPAFSALWDVLKPFIQNQTVVAHNGAFDFNCLFRTLEFYGLEQPTYQKQCTYRIYGKSLSTVCEEYKIPLNHHDALSDAMACAELFRLYLASR